MGQRNVSLMEKKMKKGTVLKGNTIEIRYTTHEQFKQQTAESQAVIRSGECSPYANIILCAGVTF